MPYGVLLVDDHKILRDGIKAILEQTAEFQVVGQAANGSSAVCLCRKLEPDLVVMDLRLPGINGIEATTEIVRRCARTKVIILTMSDDENSVVAAFRSGVRGFLLKKASAADLLDALRTVAKGGCYLSSDVSNHLLNRIQRGDLDPKAIPDPIAANSSPRKYQIGIGAEQERQRPFSSNQLITGILSIALIWLRQEGQNDRFGFVTVKPLGMR